MALIEIAYKVGNGGGKNFSPRVHTFDGMPCAVKPKGMHVLAADFQAWVKKSTLPPGFMDLTTAQRRPHELLIARIRYAMSDPPIQEAVKISGRSVGNSQEAIEALNLTRIELDHHKATYDRVLAEGGLDTNWGFEELKHFSILLADLSHEDVVELMDEPLDPTTHPWAPVVKTRRKAYRIKYEDLLSGETLDRIRDPNEKVVPPRNSAKVTLFKFADCAVRM